MSEQLAIQQQSEAAQFELLQREAKMLANSSLVPKEFQGNVANCGIAIGIARQLGASTFAVVNGIHIIHGRPAWSAQHLIGMVNASRRFSPLRFHFEGEGDGRSCYAYAKSTQDGETVRGPSVSMEMAKKEGWLGKNGSKWQTMPELMLSYRAGAFFARLYAPDITLGMLTSEEMTDIGRERNVTPARPLFAETVAETGTEEETE